MQVSAAARIIFIFFSTLVFQVLPRLNLSTRVAHPRSPAPSMRASQRLMLPVTPNLAAECSGAMRQPAVARQNTELRHHRCRRQDQHLRHHRYRGIDELRQQREEEQQRLGIGQLQRQRSHINAGADRRRGRPDLPQNHRVARLGRAQRLDSQINQISRAHPFGDGKETRAGGNDGAKARGRQRKVNAVGAQDSAGGRQRCGAERPRTPCETT